MPKRKKKAPTFRTLITKRIAKAGNKKDALSELRKQRERDQKALKKLNASIEREERRLTKAKRALSRAKLKKLKTQKAQHKRRLKTLANIRKVVTERRNKRGRKTQRKSKFTDVSRFSAGKNMVISEHMNLQNTITRIITYL